MAPPSPRCSSSIARRSTPARRARPFRSIRQDVLDAVRTYVSTADLGDRFDGFEVVGVDTDGGSVTVTLRASRRLPFLGYLAGGTGEGVVIEATATAARAPFVD